MHVSVLTLIFKKGTPCLKIFEPKLFFVPTWHRVKHYFSWFWNRLQISNLTVILSITVPAEIQHLLSTMLQLMANCQKAYLAQKSALISKPRALTTLKAQLCMKLTWWIWDWKFRTVRNYGISQMFISWSMCVESLALNPVLVTLNTSGGTPLNIYGQVVREKKQNLVMVWALLSHSEQTQFLTRPHP